MRKTSAERTQPSSFRRDIQGLRAIAVLLVVLYHAGVPVPGGFLGVDVFFAISGYVITKMLLRELGAHGRLRFRRFYARRVRRLLPALAPVLAFVALASVFVLSPLGTQQQTAWTGIGAALMSSNGVLFLTTGGYFDSAAEVNPLLHTWSLSVEEQFYLVFPLLIAVAWRVSRGRSGRTLVWVIVAATVVSFAANVLLTFGEGAPFGSLGSNRQFAFYASPPRAWELTLGALVAALEARLLARLSRRMLEGLAVVGLTLLTVSVVTIDSSTAFPGYAAVLPIVAMCLLLIAGASETRMLQPLRSRAMVRIGDLSYSWYLWHWPLLVFWRLLYPSTPLWATVVVAAGSLAPAYASYRLVEEPIRHGPLALRVRVPQIAAAAVVLPAVLFGSLGLSASRPGQSFAQIQQDYASHLDLANGCMGNLPGTPETSGLCTWRVADSRGTVLLLGDSNAGHFAEGVIPAANAQGYDVVMGTFGGCLPAEVTIVRGKPYDARGCDAFLAAWQQWIVTEAPAGVVLASASASYVTADGYSFIDRADGSRSTTTPTRGTASATGLERYISAWSDNGTPTLLVHTVPGFPDFDLSHCPSVWVQRDPGRCGRVIPEEESERRLRAARHAEDEVAARRDNVTTLDLTDRLCPNGVCRTDVGGRFRYRDGAHLSVPYVASLESLFAQKMQAAFSDLGRCEVS